MTEDKLGRVIDRIYEAGLDHSQWRSVLHEISDAIGADGGAIFGFPDSVGMGAVWSEGIDGLANWAFNEGAHLHNPRPQRALQIGIQTVVTEAELCTPWELDHLPFNAEMIHTLGYRWDMGAIFTEIEGDPVLFTTQRLARRERFETAEKAVIQALVPHLQRAAQIGARLSRARADGMLDAFDEVSCAAIALDFRGRVVRANRASAAIAGDALQFGRDGISAADSEANAKLQRLIGSVIHTPKVKMPRSEWAVAIPRKAGRPLVAYAMPVKGAAADIFQSAKALLLLVDPASQRDRAPLVLKEIFGLTGAEVQLVLSLAKGKELPEIAEERGVSLMTLRTQLKSIFAKTDTHRQAELVALIAKLV